MQLLCSAYFHWLSRAVKSAVDMPEGMLYSYAECTYLQTIWLTQILPTMNLTLTTYLADNCIVFENFTASIGDLMVANRVYCPF